MVRHVLSIPGTLTKANIVPVIVSVSPNPVPQTLPVRQNDKYIPNIPLSKHRHILFKYCKSIFCFFLICTADLISSTYRETISPDEIGCFGAQLGENNFVILYKEMTHTTFVPDGLLVLSTIYGLHGIHTVISRFFW